MATRESSSNPNTVATLTNNSMDNGVRVLQSTLHIVASLSSPNPSVTCVHIDSGDTSSLSFQVLVDPGMPREMISKQTMDETERCVLHLAWSSPSNIALGHVMTYMIKIDGNNSVNETNSDNSTQNLFAHPVCTCGPRTVTISTVNICHHVGPSTPDVTLRPKLLSTSVTCPVTTTYVLTVTDPECTDCDRVPQKCSHVAVIILAIVVVILLVTTIVFAVLWCTETPPPKWSQFQANVKLSNVKRRTEDENTEMQEDESEKKQENESEK